MPTETPLLVTLLNAVATDEQTSVAVDVTRYGSLTFYLESSAGVSSGVVTIETATFGPPSGGYTGTWAVLENITVPAAGAQSATQVAGAFQLIRARVSTVVAGGTVTVRLVANAAGGAVAASGSGGSGDGTIIDGASPSIEATVLDYTNANPLAVRLTDTSGDYVGAGAGTQYTEDAAAAADPVGTALILVRKDTPSTTVTTDGDNVAQRGTNYGAAYVTLLDTGGSPVSVGGGTQYTEDVASAADPIGTAQMLVRADSLAAVTTTDGDNVAARGTNKGEVYVKHVDTVPVTDNAGSLTVDAPVGTPAFVRLSDGSASITTLPVSLASVPSHAVTIASVPSHAVTNAGTFAVQVDGASLTALQLIDDAVYAEDIAAQAADKGISILAVRRDADTSLVGTDNDYAQLQVNAAGALKVAITAGSGSGGTAMADDAAFTVGTTSMTPVGGTYKSTRDSVDDGDVGAFAMTPKRGQYVTIETPNGDSAMDETNDAIKVAIVADSIGSAVDTEDGTVAPGTANVALVVGLGYGYDGTNWVRQLSPVKVDDAAFTPATSTVQMIGFEADEASTDSVDEGDAGAARMTLDRKIIVTAQPHTAGGMLIHKNLDVDETEDEIKATAGQVYGWYLCNRATSIRYVKFYNATAANVTVGSTTPVMTLPIPGNATDAIAANALGAHGIAFDTAICIAATTGFADNDSGAPGANDIIANVFYK